MTLAHTRPLPRPAAAGGLREVADLAYPVVLTTLSTTLMGVVDSAMVGRLGPTELAAVGFGSVWLWTCFSLFYGASTGVQTFVSQADGAGRAERCGEWVWHASWALLPPLCLVVGGLALVLDTALTWIGPSPGLRDASAVYVRARLPGEIAVAATMLFASWFRGLGDTRTPLWATLAGNAVNAVLDYGLIFGAFGLPAWGVYGAGLATAIGHGCAAAILLALLLRPAARARWATTPIGPDRAAMRRFLRTGAPIGGEWLLGMTSFAAFNTLVARMGDTEMAASQVFMVLLSLSFMQAMGLSMAAATLVGRYKGAGDSGAAERSFRSALALGALLGGGIALLFLALPGPLVRLFSDDPAVLALGAPLLAMGAVFQLFDAFGIIAEGGLRGAGDTRWPFAVHTLLGWGCFVPGAWLLGHGLGLGLFGAWCGGLAFVVALAAVMLWRFRSGAWRGIEV